MSQYRRSFNAFLVGNALKLSRELIRNRNKNDIEAEIHADNLGEFMPDITPPEPITVNNSSLQFVLLKFGIDIFDSLESMHFSEQRNNFCDIQKNVEDRDVKF